MANKKKKTLKTSKENDKGRNIKSIDLKNLTEKENRELIKKVEAGKLLGYQVVKPKGRRKYLRSVPDRTKKNNLDPMVGMRKRK